MRTPGRRARLDWAGPHGARRADPPPAHDAADAPPGDTRHRAALASAPGCAEVDLPCGDGAACEQVGNQQSGIAERGVRSLATGGRHRVDGVAEEGASPVVTGPFRVMP